MTAKLSIGEIQSNSKLVSAKHWTYETLNEYINASVMILPIEKYIEDITRGREDMNFIFEWRNNILRTSAAGE